MNFKILKSSHSRCGGMGSLLNLNKIPGSGPRVAVQRSNSARECSLAVGGGVSIVNGNITKHSSLANTRNNNNNAANIHYTEANTDRGQVRGIYWLLNHFYYRMNLVPALVCPVSPHLSLYVGGCQMLRCVTPNCVCQKSLENLNISNKIWR